MSLGYWLETVVNRVGRTVEFAITGESNFRLSFSQSSKDSAAIVDPTRAKDAQDDVRRQLRVLFGMDFRWPILVDLRQPPAQGWRATFYNPEGNLGRYTMQELKGHPTHQIMLAPGLSRVRFGALLAHELTHAFQRETGILASNQALREGMARWVEWHFLKHSNTAEAAKLLKIKHYTFGRSIETIIDYEKRHGRNKTLEWLCKH